MKIFITIILFIICYVSSVYGNTSYKYCDMIIRAGNIYNVDPQLIRAVIMIESSFNADAVSKVGAGGLMQLMPKTAKWLGVTDVFNPEQNIMGGTKYLRQLLSMYGEDIELALAAYNAGVGNVRRFGGVPPFKETQNHIVRTMKLYDKFRGV